MQEYEKFVQIRNEHIINFLKYLKFKGYPVRGTNFTSFDRSKRFDKVYKLLIHILYL
jgi:hypothetical protein